MGRFLESRRRLIRKHGRMMVLRQIIPGKPPREVTLMGFPRSYRPGEIEGAIQQGDQQVEILADDLAGQSSVPLLTDPNTVLAPSPNTVLATGSEPWKAVSGKNFWLILDGQQFSVQGARSVYEGSKLIGISLFIRG